MRKLCRFTSFILILSMIMSLASCGGDGKDKETTAVETEPPIDPVAVETYTAAIDSLNTFTTYTQNISIKTTKYIGNEVIEETAERKCHFLNTDANEFASVITENKFIGGNSASTVEIFKAGNIYLEYKDSLDSLYTSRSTRDDYLSTQIPLAAIDLELYGTVSTDTADGAAIILEAPTALEAWVTDATVTVNDASASVKMNPDGTVGSFTYNADYYHGIAHIVSEYVIELDTKTEMTIPSAQSHSKYKAVSDIRIPKMINEAICYTSGTFTGSATSTIAASSYATATAIEIDETYYTYGNSADEYLAKSETTVTRQSSEETTSDSEVKTYINGKLTVTVEESKSETEADGTEISEIISSSLAAHIIAPHLMEDAELSDGDGFFVIDFTGSNELGASYEHYSSYLLHGDGKYLSNMADAFSVTNISGFICIDKETMLPCSMGITFEGKHTVGEADYPIYCNVSQYICAGDITAYKEITGDFQTEKEPDTQTEPLFYKVSDGDGSFIYILPTVAAGNEKTAFLPDEIYSALEECDSVAVEMNVDALDSALAENEELALLMYESCYYTDGVSASERYIDEDMYSNAVRILKAAGCYINMDTMRPSVLKEYFAMRRLLASCNLISDKSPESRIIKLANKAEIEIISLESYEDYIGKHASYSAETQEYILKTLTEESRESYIGYIEKLYELWCRGNEAELKKAVNESTLPDDASESDYNAYTEYRRIAVEEPAGRMLEATKGYLKNGESVFCVIDISYLYCENGIINGLTNEGYTVETIEYEEEAAA